MNYEYEFSCGECGVALCLPVQVFADTVSPVTVDGIEAVECDCGASTTPTQDEIVAAWIIDCNGADGFDDESDDDVDCEYGGDNADD